MKMRKTMAMLAWVLAMVGAVPAVHAQASLEGRVDQIDKRLRTVERVVSRQTGGSTGMVQPEIGPSEAPVDTTGSPATAPLADLQTRVASVEGQVAGLTGRVETAEHQLKQLQDSFDAYRRATDARLSALEGAGGGAGTGGTTDGISAAPPAGKPVAGAASRAGADPDRAQRLAGIAKPKTGDGGEDAYTYGYRLWQAKLFPEAEAQLAGFAGKYPGHARISRAQNLLGMAYLDDSKPNLAAQIFYENYSKYPDGERAADSLLNLAKALTVLKKPSVEVCRVFGEASKNYGTTLNAAQKATLDKGRAENKCK